MLSYMLWVNSTLLLQSTFFFLNALEVEMIIGITANRVNH